MEITPRGLKPVIKALDHLVDSGKPTIFLKQGLVYFLHLQNVSIYVNQSDRADFYILFLLY